MILSKVYEDAEHRLERNEITLGEFERLVDIEVIEPKRGEWIINNAGMWECTACKCMTFSKSSLWTYCPFCGADMREREGE